ncbi:F-box protein Pof8 [Schizosaccharomyces japonicus yFS275]|uniref:F-box protein Pof8 n=1 Tax=Schizosaccharomyces japonicus (strain yFS275 / FY16936) TaxID=402676 RepID=B6K780_SCHJY|nr:F-box protein Pof8 [Schizosaccharomyces japonicus yFS275]EEB09384.1 F-box protein Pof8 [Schizosaccharomyces japonicus yFS275]
MFVPRQIKRKRPLPSKEFAENAPPAKEAPVPDVVYEIPIHPSRKEPLKEAPDVTHTIKTATQKTEKNDLSQVFQDTVLSAVELQFMKNPDQDNFHISTLLLDDDEQKWASVKPAPTQKTLSAALKASKSSFFSFDENTFHVHRNEAFPSRPTASMFDRIVYVESFPATMSAKPMHLLGVLRPVMRQWLPFTKLISTPEGYAFVECWKSVTQEQLNHVQAPSGFTLLSRAEWTLREEMYIDCIVGDSKRATQRLQQSQARRNQGALVRNSNLSPSPDPTKPSPHHENPSLDSNYPKGLLTRLCNLHPLTTKSNIQAFLVHLMKQAKQDNVCIQYIDYRKDEVEAIVRWKYADQASLCISELKRQKRKMSAADDVVGIRTASEFVDAELIAGSEEASYWQLIPPKRR